MLATYLSRKSYFVLLFFLFFFQTSITAQVDSCEISLAFCTSDIYTFPASTNTTAQPGPNYGCLSSQPNPAWYHMKIAADGDIEITITSEQSRDIDFICWGPFSDAYAPCTEQLTALKIVDCSYSASPDEVCYIPAGLVDEYYILMITNYSNQPCDITFEKTGGTGETNCTIVPPPISNNSPLCVGDTLLLFADTVANTTYAWSGPNGFTSTQQNPVIPNVTVANDGIYSLIVNTAGNTSDPTYTTVQITEYPSVSFTIDVNDTLCSNELVTYTGTDASGTNISYWNWTFGDGNSTSNQIVQHLYNSGGNYTTTLIAINDGGCSDTASMNLLVKTVASVSAGSNEHICKNNIFDLSTSAVLADSSNCDSIKWIGGSGNFDNANLLLPVYTPGDTELGDVILGLIAYTSAPCGNDTSFMTLTIDSIPNLSFIILPNDTICIDVVATFNGIDINGTNIASWQWDFGDGNSSNTQNTTHTYNTILNDSVRFIAINNYNCSDTAFRNILVTNPAVSTNIAPKPACLGTTTIFNGIGDVTYANWNWDFGDGQSATGHDVSHLYSTADTFQVLLNVCSKTKIDSAFILPQAFVEAGSPANICENTPYNFATASVLPTATGYDSLLWSGGAGSFNNPKILMPVYSPAFGETGTIQLRLVAYGMIPCSNDTSYVQITYDSLPNSGYIQTPIDSICVGESISFTDTSTTNTQSWQWIFDDGSTSNLQNPNHTYYTAGIYNLKFITVNINGCSDSIVTPVQIYPIPDPYFTVLPNDTICALIPLNFSGTDLVSTNITNWDWNFGDGNLGSGQYITHTYTAPGNYTVILNVLNNNSCFNSYQQTVHVSSLPESNFTISPNDSSCLGEIIYFDASNISADITQWEWQFGDGNIANGQSVTHIYSSEGNFNINSIFTNSNGCIDTTTHQRFVQDVNIGYDIIHNPSCQNYTVNFTGTGNLITFSDWEWNFGDGYAPALGHNTSHTYTIADTFNVVLDVCSEQNIQQLVINPTCNVDAGSNEATCQNVFFNLATSQTPPTATNYTSVYWYSNGLGVIYDPTLIAPTYLPDSSEGILQIDTVIMTMVGYGIAPCENDTSQMMLLIVPGAYAQAGSDENSCIGYPFDFSSSTDSVFAANYVVLYWSTTGTGYFIDPNVERPTYIPGPNETGAITMTMVASNIINCDSIDEMILTIQPEYAIPFDTTVCHNDSLFAQGLWQHVSGTYYDTLQSQFGCDSVIITNLTVRPKIDEDFIINTSDSICYGETIGFASTGTANLVSWLWDFGDGITSTGNNPVHQYDTAGYFTVTYSFTDENGCFDFSNKQVKVFELPDVWFTNNMTNPCVNTQIDFDGNSNFNIISWIWDFGDGQTGAGQSVSHTYTTWGNMMILLTVTDVNGCNQTSYQFLNIAEPPIASFSSNIIICDSINFTDLSTCAAGYNIIEWSWDFGDGSTETLQNPTHRYPYSTSPNGDNYDVSLYIVSDSSGFQCFDSTVIQINVPSFPSVITSFSPNPSCFGDTTMFFGESNHVINIWDWDFGDGNFSLNQNTNNLYADTGNYISNLTVTDTNGCISAIYDTVMIKPLPNVSFTINTTNTCVNTQVDYAGTSSFNIVSWQWDFGDGQTGIGQNASHVYTTWGDMSVYLTVTDINGCSETSMQFLTIAQPPIANFTYSSIICDSIQFTNTSTSAPGYNIVESHWNFGDGSPTVIAQDTSHQYPHNTTPGGEVYNVSLLIFADSSGFVCTNSVVIPVTVPPLPDIFYTFTPDPTCYGDTTHFYGESGYYIGTWNWDFGDGNTSLSQYSTNLYADTGSYTVTLGITDTLGCANTLTKIVRVNPVPQVSFTMSDSVTCHGNGITFISTASSNVAVWYWEFGDGSYSYSQNPYHYYSNSGTYQVSLTVTDTAGCSSTAGNEVLILPSPTADYTYTPVTCSSMLFTDQSVAPTGYTIVEWQWDFGDGTTTTVQNPSHSYGTGGAYDVTLIVRADSTTSSYSCYDTIVQTVVMPGAPSVYFTWNPEPTMLGDATGFNGTSGSNITDWYWDFGDGNFATTQNANNTFAAIGTYDVELTVTDINGCTNNIIHQITVTNVPELDYSWGPSCEGNAVQFTIESPPTDIPAVVSWNWDFGDGAVSTDMEPIHTYNVANTYNVSLTIIDTMGATNTVIKPITVNPPPVSLFSIDAPSCSSAPVQFHNLSTTPTGFITEWLWDFGDGNTTTVTFPDDPDVTHAYATTGTYIVTLTITNSDSCTNSSTNTVTTIPGPTAMFTHDSGCASGPVTFTDTSIENGGGAIISWNWNFDDLASGPGNTSTLQNPVHQFSAPGDYNVELIVSNINGCADTTTTVVTVADAPTVEFTYSSACLGSETQFTVDELITNVSNVQTWLWSFGDGSTSNLQNPTHTYATTGNYTVLLTIVTTDGCTASVSHIVPISPLPNPNFESTTPACLNDTVYFTDLSSSPNGLITTWHWDFGDGTEITISAPDNPDVSHLYTNNAIFAVTLTVTDGDTCENTIVKQLEIVASPIADYSYLETCYNEPVYFTDLSTTNGGTDIYSWEWFFGDPNSGIENHSTLQNPTHLYTQPGVYDATLIILSTTGCSDTTVQQITIDSLPNVDFTMLDDSICMGGPAEFTGISSSDISTWSWDFGDGGYSIEQNPTYMYSAPGTYIVTLTVTEIGPDACENSISHTIYVNDAPQTDFDYQNTCQGDSTYFTDLSYSQNGFIVGWQWDFGDGTTSTVQDPTHYYINNDSYTVTLISTDNYGCTDTLSQWIQVYSTPISNFTYNQQCEPKGQVNFFDNSQVGEDGSPIESWNWNLYNGYYSTEIDPNYIYPQTDTCYTVILEITDGNGCISTDTNTQVCLYGTIDIDYTSTQECLGTPTFFTASYMPASDSVASYTWNFNDGSQNAVTYHDTISHTFTTPGLFIVELTALDTNGCSISIYHEVVIDSLPTPQFSNTTGSCNTATQFTDESFGGGEFIDTWNWNFGDIASGANNTSTIQNPSHLYGPYDSTYQVKLIVTNFNGCTDSIVQQVYVEPCLIADFTLPTEPLCARYDNICFSDISQLSSNNGSITQWRWDFGDGQSYNYGVYQDSICHSYTDGGDYTVQLVVEAIINSITYNDTITHQLTVHPTPEAGIIVENNCLGDSTIFTDNTITNSEPLTMWYWNFGDNTTLGDTSIQQNPTYMYPIYNTYTVELKVMNMYSCRDSITAPVEIYKPPQAAFSYAETCMSYNTYFTDESIGDSSAIDQYLWDFGDTLTQATSTEQNPYYVYDSTGIYNILLQVSDGNSCYDTISHTITIYPIPTASFVIFDTIQQGNIYLDNTSISATSYYWDFDYDNLVSSSEKSPMHQYETDGSYNIMLVSYNDYGCPDTTYQIYDLLFTNLFVPNAFLPSNGNAELQTFKPTGINIKKYHIEIYSTWGNLVFESTKLTNGAPSEGWDGTSKGEPLPTGSFIWRITAEFEDGTYWKGSDNGDGNTQTNGTVTLIR